MADAVYCQNIVLNIVQNVLRGGAETWEGGEFRDINRGKLINIDFEVGQTKKNYKRKSFDLASPGKGNANHGYFYEEEETSDQEELQGLKTEGKKAANGGGTNGKEASVYNFFHTELKREKSENAGSGYGYYQPLNWNKTEKKMENGLETLEENAEGKGVDIDGTYSESFHLANSTSQNASSNLKSSPDNTKNKSSQQEVIQDTDEKE